MSGENKRPGEFCWNELVTNDVAGAKEFYGTLLGWHAHTVDMGNTTYTLFRSGETDVAGMLQIAEAANNQPQGSRWLSYITVKDLNAVAEKVVHLGGTVLVPPTLLHDFGRYVVIADPSGAQVALWEPLKSCEQ